MKTLDEIVSGLISQQGAVRELKKTLGREKIVELLKMLEYNEIIDLLDEVYYEQFATAEMESGRKIKFQNLSNGDNR